MRRWWIKAPARGGGQNVDSLLDTMANVVGILIVMMAVTQLTVNDAMKRIQVWESEEAASLREARASAEQRLAEVASADLSHTLELSRLRDHIARLREMESVADTESVSADVAAQRLQVRRLEATLADTREHLADLQILLAKSEARAEREGVPLRLPDPRPAPAGADRLVMLARHGRVFDPRFDQLTRELQDVIARAPRPLDRYFDAYDVGNEMLRWRVGTKRGGLEITLEWRRPDVGETAEQMALPDADLRGVLEENDPSQRYLEFYVWGDSFEAYLEARRIAEEAGYAVGWTPIPTDFPLMVHVERGGRVTPVD